MASEPIEQDAVGAAKGPERDGNRRLRLWGAKSIAAQGVEPTLPPAQTISLNTAARAKAKGKASGRKAAPFLNLDRAVLALEGVAVCASVALGRYVDPAFDWLTVLIGVVALQSAFTGFSPWAALCRAAGVKPGQAFR